MYNLPTIFISSGRFGLFSAAFVQFTLLRISPFNSILEEFSALLLIIIIVIILQTASTNCLLLKKHFL